MMSRVSALGDTALLAPASLALFLYLLAIRRWAEARGFAAALAVGIGATLGSKLLFKACGGAIDLMNLNSPSGHASFATLFYGSLALMLASRRSRPTVTSLWVATILLVIAIGVSRVFQEAHSWPEVILGWLIGVSGLAVFLWLRRPAEPAPLSPVPLAVGLALAIALLGGRHFTAERYLDRIARAASTSFDICQNPRLTALEARTPIVPR